MNLISTTFLNSIANIIKISCGFFINKIIAIHIGPSGLALIGQLQNFKGIITTIANLGINQGITKYTAEFQSIEFKKKIFSTGFSLTIASSIITSILLIALKGFLSHYILDSNNYKSIFLVFGLTIILFSLNVFFLAILNGQKEIKKLITINIFNSIISFLISTLMILKLNLIGALYAIVINQSVIFFISMIFVIKSHWFKLSHFTNGIDKSTMLKLGKFSLITISIATFKPLSLILIRNSITEQLSWESAGLWEGLTVISNNYLLFITTTLSIYYLPKLSEIKSKKLLNQEILNGYKLLIPLTIICTFIIYIFKKEITLILFSSSFLTMLPLFKWQLIGDIFKINAWLISFNIIAKAKVRLCIITEFIFNFSYVLLSISLIPSYGLIGTTYAYCIIYLLYFILMIILFKKGVFYETN